MAPIVTRKPSTGAACNGVDEVTLFKKGQEKGRHCTSAESGSGSERHGMGVRSDLHAFIVYIVTGLQLMPANAAAPQATCGSACDGRRNDDRLRRARHRYASSTWKGAA